MIYRGRFFCLLILLQFLLVLNANSEKIPMIYLKDGVNEILFSIKNNKRIDFHEINLEIEKEKLPSWMKIDVIEKTNYSQRMRKVEKIKVVLEVLNAPLIEYAEIPLNIFDDNGNRWNYVLKICVNSDEVSGFRYYDTLHNNFPNPFNPITTIRYSLAEERHTKLVIFNLLGQNIRTLVDGLQTSGIHEVKWDGCDNKGQKVASGIYIYRLVSGSFVENKQMILLE